MQARSNDRLLALAAAVAVAAALALIPAAARSAGSQPFCPGVTGTAGLPQKPGPPLRFGVSPNVQTGQLGTGAVAPRTPEDPRRQLAALAALDPSHRPLVLRLTRFFWSDGAAGVNRYLALARRYTRAGWQVELQLRYHPPAGAAGDMKAWTAFVREVVDRFGPNRRVVGIQVTNEVNLAISPDSSDGSFAGGRDALIDGVIAAHAEAARRGYRQLKIGFNWADRADPSSDGAFWTYLRDHGGTALRDALDWIGLDSYPGTFFPPTEVPGREGDGLINGISALRCYAESAGIPDSVPMRIEENGYPTGDSADRSDARQVQAMQAMVGAADAYRGTYDVSDYRWFDLRDSDSTSPNFQQRYGLMTDTYTPKPAFWVFKQVIATLSGRAAPRRAGRARLRLALSCDAGRLRVALAGRGRRRVRKLRVRVGGRARTRRHRPFVVRFDAPRARAVVHARVRLAGGRTLRLRRTVRACHAYHR